MGTINVHHSIASIHCLLWQLRMPLGPGEGKRPGEGSAWYFVHQMIGCCTWKYFFLKGEIKNETRFDLNQVIAYLQPPSGRELAFRTLGAL